MTPTHFAVATAELPTSPLRRFRSLVTNARKVHKAAAANTDRRGSIGPKTQNLNRPPGIDVLHPPAYIVEAHCKHVNIVVVDYNAEHVSAKCLDNDSIEAFLQEPRPDHSKVRWINLEGLSFDVVKTLGIKFGLHPLAVEDVFHLPQRAKVDFFEEHLYANMVMPIMMMDANSQAGKGSAYEEDGSLSCVFKGHHEKLRKTAQLKPAILEQLIRPDMFMEECSFFLLDNGVLISIFPFSGRQITDRLLELLFGSPSTLSSSTLPFPIKAEQKVFQDRKEEKHDQKQPPLTQFVESLHQTANSSRLTLLRKSCDASFLLHSLMDGVVDGFTSVTELYDQQISLIQDEILVKPKAGYTKSLLFLFSVYFLDLKKFQPTEKMLLTLKEGQYLNNMMGTNENRISDLSKTYFGAVLDHCLNVLEELGEVDQAAIALVDLTFNTIAHQTNESMRYLAVVSFVFLPITFVCGYYGMNFENFPELHMDLGVNYFWIWTVILILASLVVSDRLGLLRSY
ncbi:cora-like Mg2+ transporter protein-domain-containing protein [Obelidium mucronatum]|nr:cora-like Mg2+ transporter protein-domain-containing protein [Obelidium mucronatum]